MSGNKVVFRPIGVVRTQASDDEIREVREERDSTIEVFPEFEDGLEGLDGHSHIFVLCHMNRLRLDQIGPLKVKPRRLLKRGFNLEELPLVGVFAIDSPTRPNPIGLSLVKLVRREGRLLHVQGLDSFNGTPVLDIKPYGESYRVSEYTVPEWRRKMHEKVGEEI